MPDDVEEVARAAYAAYCAVMRPDEPIEWGRGGYATQVVEWEAIARAIIPIIRDDALEDAADLAQHRWLGGLSASGTPSAIRAMKGPANAG